GGWFVPFVGLADWIYVAGPADCVTPGAAEADVTCVAVWVALLLGVGEGAGGDQGADGPQCHRQGGEGEALALPDLAEGLRGHSHRRLVARRPGGEPLLRGPGGPADAEHVLGEQGMRGVQVVA